MLAGSRALVRCRLGGFTVETWTRRRAGQQNPDDLQHLATALRGAGGALDAADARLRQRLGAVSWAGGDAIEVGGPGTWRSAATAGGQRWTRSVAEALEAQAIEQRQASGDVAAGPGERPGEVRSPVEPGAVPEDSTTAGGGPPPVTVLTETHTVGLEGGGSPVDGRAEATMRLTVADDGTAQVTVATDQRIGALAGEASAGVGVGLTGSRDLALSFADEATARRFISQMTDALDPGSGRTGPRWCSQPVGGGAWAGGAGTGAEWREGCV